MQKHRFARQLGGEVILDLCFSCQGIWFDEYESAQIAPGGVIELFKLIHQNRDAPRHPLPGTLHCPRCQERMLHGLDVSKFGGQFNYHRCLQKHGRFTCFAQFMIEKGFVRQLARSEIEQLATRVQTIRCGGCGAAVDIRREHACTHCGSPIALLDPQAVEQALQRLQSAENRRQHPDPTALGDLIISNERYKSQMERQKQLQRDHYSIVDLIVDGADLISNLLQH